MNDVETKAEQLSIVFRLDALAKETRRYGGGIVRAATVRAG